MTDKIEPALSAERWAEALAPNATIKPNGRYEIETGVSIFEPIDPTPSQRIALLNHILPDSDPRKITREKIATLREVIDEAVANGNEHWPGIAVATQLADALESYLPPRKSV